MQAEIIVQLGNCQGIRSAGTPHLRAMRMTQSYLPAPCGKCAAKLNVSAIVSSIVLLFSIVLSACGSNSLPGPPVAHEAGQLTKGEDVFGTFYTYVPTTVPDMADILVLVHGTPLKDEPVEWNAEYYIANWIDFAEKHGFVLLAPVFNQENFSSRRGTML